MENQVQQTFETLMKHMGFDISKISIEKKDEVFCVNIDVEDASLLIGKNAMNLKALQLIAKLVLSKGHEKSVELFLDINGYRKQQEENVKKLALEAVESVRENSRPYALPPMSAYFRRIVHMYLAEDQFKDITTESRGDSYFRHIVVKLS